MKSKLFFFLLSFTFFSPAVFSMENEKSYGVEFICNNSRETENLSNDLKDEFKNFSLDKQIIIDNNAFNHTVRFFIDQSLISTNDTTNIKKEFRLSNDKVYLPTLKKYLFISSKKEILLALTYPGRLTQIDSCDISALKEHIGIRQNIVLFASHLSWQWPDGDHAFWNKKLWTKGTPNDLNRSYEALYDSFLNQSKYGIGCYTATKMVYVFAVLDYYKRVNPNKQKFNVIMKELLRDNDPLVAVEPGVMWKFEETYNPEVDNYSGKILELHDNIASNSIVPGDWIYLLNTDSETYQKIGYEGSNAIYLGNNKFDDYYNDNNHFYTFEQKLDEVYQWRNKVFSRSRDFKLIKHLTSEDIKNLKKSPENNGIFMMTRTVPKFFN